MRKLVLGLLVLLVGGYLALRRPDIPLERLEAAYANPQSQYAYLPNGVRMHYRDQGHGAGPTLLWPPTPGNGWISLLPRSANDVDLRGPRST